MELQLDLKDFSIFQTKIFYHKGAVSSMGIRTDLAIESTKIEGGIPQKGVEIDQYRGGEDVYKRQLFHRGKPEFWVKFQHCVVGKKIEEWNGININGASGNRNPGYIG